ncbi:MAG: hypothetical protein ACOYL6_06725 [Bacteriovoracaceae bacterium]
MTISDLRSKILTIPDFERIKAIALYGTLATIAFVTVYGWCNTTAAQAKSHYELFTEWELTIPLIPWMIFPYISLNLLFVVAPFILKTVGAIKGFCLSMVWGALVAGLFFYFTPGKLGFTRVDVPEFQEMYSFMFSIDHPHNLFPSLHVTYSSLAILSMREETHSKAFHLFLYLWLFLITISVVLVHQHHLFDVLTGALLAGILYRFIYRRYTHT